MLHPGPPSQRLERFEYSQVHMGMPVRIVLHAAAPDAPRIASRAFSLIASLDAEGQAEIKNASREIAAKFETDGSDSFPALALGAVARKS